MCVPYFLKVSYIGTAFYGWQIQSTLRSVQGELWRSLQALESDVPMPQGTGRTDAGVHAKAQGVLVRMKKPWDCYRLQSAINAHCSPDVRVMEVQQVDPEFWPRHHAVCKRYIYRIWEGPCEDPFEYGRRWHVKGSAFLDQEAMGRAITPLIGRHDFSAFRHQECAAASPIRTIHSIVLENHGQALDLVFEGNSFLMHQVRIMTGTLVDIGKGRIPAENMEEILEAQQRQGAGRTAPPHGLYLEKVWYQSRWGVSEASPWGESDTKE